MLTSSAFKTAAALALAAGLAAAQTTPVRNLEFEGDADAAGFTIRNLPLRFALDAGLTPSDVFANAVQGLNARIDGLVLDAAPDLMAVTQKGDYANSLRVLRQEINTHDGTNIVSGAVATSFGTGTMNWNGSVFKNTTASAVLGFAA